MLGVAQKKPYENHAEKQEKQELANKCTAQNHPNGTMRARLQWKGAPIVKTYIFHEN
jgi:hypothetical protein